MPSFDYRTVSEIARMAGKSDRQVDFAIKSNRIDPSRRVGIIRMFDEPTTERIISALKRVGEPVYAGSR